MSMRHIWRIQDKALIQFHIHCHVGDLIND